MVLFSTWLSSLFLSSLLFSLAYLVLRALRFYSAVDVLWALAFIPTTALYCLRGDAATMDQIALCLIPLSLWSLRLSTHLAGRLFGHYPREDNRYQALREKWAPQASLRFFFFFQMQAASVALLSTPFLVLMSEALETWGSWQLTGLALWAIGVAGEMTADWQLNHYRQDPLNRGQTCRRGLWRYSRHPNYFFEWLTWLGFACLAQSASLGFLAWSAPALILFFILKVTGIPPSEAQALKSRGDDYRDYQQTTSVFFPMPPRARR